VRKEEARARSEASRKIYLEFITKPCSLHSSSYRRLSAFSKLVAAPTRLDEVDKAIKRKKARMKLSSGNSKFLSRVRSTFSRKSNGSTDDDSSNDGDSLLSSKSSLSSNDTNKKHKKHHKHHQHKRKSHKKDKFPDDMSYKKKGDGDEDSAMVPIEEDEDGKKFRIWNVINEGQPGIEFAFGNFVNNVSCTLLHLKRSKSKLMESKKMASQQEIDYLSATHGLQFNKDSSLCFELITWRRSALWVLVLFGITNMYFGTVAFIESHINMQYDRRLAEKAETHRFPVPGYVNQNVLDYWGLEDPSAWTLYYGSISFNYTQEQSIFKEGRTYYMGVTGPTSAQTNIDGRLVDNDPTPDPGAPLGLKSGSFTHGNQWDRFSLNVNGTLRNGHSFCVNAAEDKVGAAVTVENCVADFIGYEVESEALDKQTWIRIDEKGRQTNEEKNVRLQTPGGHCLGVSNWRLCADNPSTIESDGTNRCLQYKNAGLCVDRESNAKDLCPVTCVQCNPDVAETPGTQLDQESHINMVLVDCIHTPHAQFKESEALSFKMPYKKSYQERMDYLCDGEFKKKCAEDTSNSHVNLDMTLVAR